MQERTGCAGFMGAQNHRALPLVLNITFSFQIVQYSCAIGRFVSVSCHFSAAFHADAASHMIFFHAVRTAYRSFPAKYAWMKMAILALAASLFIW